MNKLTRPEIAEALRQHIHTDNDAKRLICEHVLPLVGLDVSTPGEIEYLLSTKEHLLEKVSNLERRINEESFSDRVTKLEHKLRSDITRDRKSLDANTAALGTLDTLRSL